MKKFIKVIIISLVLTLLLSIGASAATPRWTYLFSITPDISKTNDTYGATVSAHTNVVKIDVELVLYQKGLFGIYSKKATHSGTINNYTGKIKGSYDMSLDKQYKVVVTATATSNTGATESATGELAV